MCCCLRSSEWLFRFIIFEKCYQWFTLIYCIGFCRIVTDSCFFDNCFPMVTAHCIHMAYVIWCVGSAMVGDAEYRLFWFFWHDMASLIHSQSQDCVGAKLQWEGKVQFFQFNLLSPDAMKEALLIVQAWLPIYLLGPDPDWGALIDVQYHCLQPFHLPMASEFRLTVS